jgi:hypothetical protein
MTCAGSTGNMQGSRAHRSTTGACANTDPHLWQGLPNGLAMGSGLALAHVLVLISSVQLIITVVLLILKGARGRGQAGQG